MDWRVARISSASERNDTGRWWVRFQWAYGQCRNLLPVIGLGAPYREGGLKSAACVSRDLSSRDKNPPATQVFAVTPCCDIVSIDKATGIVTLRDKKTGQLEKVTVKDPAQLAKLTAGQAADRSIGQH